MPDDDGESEDEGKYNVFILPWRSGYDVYPRWIYKHVCLCFCLSVDIRGRYQFEKSFQSDTDSVWFQTAIKNIIKLFPESRVLMKISGEAIFLLSSI